MLTGYSKLKPQLQFSLKPQLKVRFAVTSIDLVVGSQFGGGGTRAYRGGVGPLLNLTSGERQHVPQQLVGNLQKRCHTNPIHSSC